MLSQILLRADVRPGSRILLYETCHGLVAGALTQMLGGTALDLDNSPGRAWQALRAVMVP